MIKLQEKYLPRQLEHEYGYRQQYDPLFTEQALDFQRKYGPQISAQQMAILQQQDPEWVAAHKTFGDRVKQALERGYVDPQRAAAYGALGKQVTGDTLRGATMDPETCRQTTQAIMSRSPNLELRRSAGHGDCGVYRPAWSAVTAAAATSSQPVPRTAERERSGADSRWQVHVHSDHDFNAQSNSLCTGTAIFRLRESVCWSARGTAWTSKPAV